MKHFKKNRNKGIPQHNWLYYLKLFGIAIPIIGGVFWAGYYTHSNIASVEMHEKEMQLYKTHLDIDEGLKKEIRQLESEKRELEKEIHQLRKENLQLNNNNHGQGNSNKNN